MNISDESYRNVIRRMYMNISDESYRNAINSIFFRNTITNSNSLVIENDLLEKKLSEQDIIYMLFRIKDDIEMEKYKTKKLRSFNMPGYVLPLLFLVTDNNEQKIRKILNKFFSRNNRTYVWEQIMFFYELDVSFDPLKIELKNINFRNQLKKYIDLIITISNEMWEKYYKEVTSNVLKSKKDFKDLSKEQLLIYYICLRLVKEESQLQSFKNRKTNINKLYRGLFFEDVLIDIYDIDYKNLLDHIFPFAVYHYKFKCIKEDNKSLKILYMIINNLKYKLEYPELEDEIYNAYMNVNDYEKIFDLNKTNILKSNVYKNEEHKKEVDSHLDKLFAEYVALKLQTS